MKNFQILYIALTLGCMAFASCQKVIDIDVNTSTSQLVIEGNITNIRGTQYVIVSRSVAYTEPNNYPAVTGANVQVTDNLGNTYKFNEMQKGNYAFGPLRGQSGRTYTLTVKVDNQTYTASSVMPAPVTVDSLSLSKVTFGSSERRLVAVNYTDPKGTANQYRYVLRVNGKTTNRIYVEDDRLTDGNFVKEELYPYDDNDDTEDLKTGDLVSVEVQCIDKNIFNYWYTLRSQRRGGPGGGTTPGNPPSNINNNALGYFSAHTYQTLDLVIP
jgi:hypothetical protein